MAETPVTNIRLPVGLKLHVKALAEERGITLTEAFIEALNDWAHEQEARQLSRKPSSSPSEPSST